MIRIASVFAAICAMIFAIYMSYPSIPDNSPHVKIILTNGHGSGTHIGGGFILTAAHVMTGDALIQLDDGSVHSTETLWINKKYDVALIRADVKIQSAPLDCRSIQVGETFQMHGNPTILDNIVTVGRYAGEPRQAGPWARVLPVDGVIVMGMSGGGVISNNGYLIGINVGVLTANVGFGISITGIGFIVPAPVICDLLGRT